MSGEFLGETILVSIATADVTSSVIEVEGNQYGPEDFIRALSSSSLASLTSDQIPLLSSDQVSAFSNENEQLVGFSSAQLSWFGGAQVG